jgi:CheY-like chemotaxis protein
VHAKCLILEANCITGLDGLQAKCHNESPETTPNSSEKLRQIILKATARTLAIILNNAGFEARGVFNGAEAVELFESFPPDLIADVIMPGMTGIEVAIIARERLPACKILLFSGQAATSDLLDQARSRGHEFEILAKPVHPVDLLAKLRG